MKGESIEQNSRRISIYQEIADEYYDHIRHPTSRDLGFLSRKMIISLIDPKLYSTGKFVELGAGDSVLAGAETFRNFRPRIVLIDNSWKMLLHTKEIENFAYVLASAEATGLPAQSAALVVASLGDPYNCFNLWKEVERLLEVNGKCIFTTPSFEWSSTFRTQNECHIAEFLRLDGSLLSMPSYIYALEEQVAMIELAGLCVDEVRGIGADALGHTPAPKLTCVTANSPLVSGYVVRKRV